MCRKTEREKQESNLKTDECGSYGETECGTKCGETESLKNFPSGLYRAMDNQLTGVFQWI